MKVTFVFPKFPFEGRVPMVPPVLEYLGALTLKCRPGTEVELLDANVCEPKAQDIDADLIGISAMTTTVVWAYKFADELRVLGKTVVLGGIHCTALPDEAKQHADSVVIGEAESVWAEVLDDAAADRLKDFYHGERESIEELPLPLTGRLEGRYIFRALFTKRGCPFKCTFCSVRKFFGDTLRYRNIANVVDEVESCMGKVYFNGDDNIWGGDVNRAIELFNELARGTSKKWYGFGDLLTPQKLMGDKLLRAARDSGLYSVWAGWETSSSVGLEQFKALAKQGSDRVDAIKRIKDHGIEVILFVILGSRTDTPKEFEQALELGEKLGVGIHPALLTPLPGTELYEQYKLFLLKDRGWEFYNGANSVFEHPSMSPDEIEGSYYDVATKLLSRKRIFSHLMEMPRDGFPFSHLLVMMRDTRMRQAILKARDKWKANGIQRNIQRGILNT